MVLDFKGGPNHRFNYCNSPIMLNRKKDSYTKKLPFYYIEHFSKFIAPGSIRIGFSKFSTEREAL